MNDKSWCEKVCAWPGRFMDWHEENRFRSGFYLGCLTTNLTWLVLRLADR